MKHPSKLEVLSIALACFILAALLLSKLATAADFYITTLVPGADAGTTAVTQIGSGEQGALFCETYSGVRYRVCQSSSCTATSTDSPVYTDKHTDFCAPSGYSYVSVYKGYDGGNPNCYVYKVMPSMQGLCAR